MKILDKYVLREMMNPFLVSIFACLVLWVGNVVFRNIDLLIRMRPEFPIALRLIVYQVPWALGMSIPAAVLFAASISVNRLAYDSEMTAMRMAGTSLRRIFIPIFLVGAVASGLTFWLDESITPRANQAAEQARNYILYRQPVPLIQENVFFNSEGYYFYVHKVDRTGKRTVKLERVMVYELRPGEYPMLITAKTAMLQDNVWSLRDGILHKLGPDGLTEYEMKFPEMKLNLNRAAQTLWDTQRGTASMNLRELNEQISMFSGSGREVTRLKVDWYFKLSLPLSCLVLALCAAPLAFRFSRVGSYTGILLGVVVYFLHFNAIILGQFLGKGGVIPPFIAAWYHIILFGLVGLYLIWREE